MTLNLLKITGIALVCLFLMMLPASAVPTITTTGLHPNVIQLMPTPIPDPSVLKTASAESKIIDSRVIIGNFTKQLEFLNNEMNWNLSPEQINNYSASMRNGVLKKYVYHPQYPEALDIPNQRQFYFEIGNELGLTQEESAKIVQKIEENYRKNFESTDPPSWDTSSVPNLEISNITPLRTTDMPTQEAPVGVEIGLIALGCGGLLLSLKDGAITDRSYNFGMTGDIPVSGDWNDDGITEIGIYRPSTYVFYLDYNGNGAWNGAVTDRQYNFGISEDLPVTGDWNNNGITEIGIFRPSTHLFYLDYNGNGAWDGAVTDRQYNFGISEDLPVTGDWNNNGITEIGVFRPSTHLYYQDYSGNGAWDGALIDRSYNFGITGDIPVSGKWI